MGFAEWRLDWKLRLSVSITEPRASYGYPQPTPKPVRHRPHCRSFWGNGEVGTEFLVENDIVEVIFPIPDCIGPLKKSWGAVNGGPILLSSGIHHCQAQILAMPPKYNSSLKRNNDGIEFVETDLGKERIILALEFSPRWKRIMKITESFLKRHKA